MKYFAKDSLQARSQDCLSGMANFYLKDHVVQCLRAYFILYAIIIKCIQCIQENMEFSCVTRTRVDISQIFMSHPMTLLGYEPDSFLINEQQKPVFLVSNVGERP